MIYLFDIDELDSRITRRAFHPKDREFLFLKYNGRCFWCKRLVDNEKWVIDHIIPWEKGGVTRRQNGALSCQGCNVRKGKTWDKWRAYDAGALFVRRVQQNANFSSYMIEEKDAFRVYNFSNVIGLER